MEENVYLTSNEDIFKDLFVLELANNHWGSLERGLKIIQSYAKVAKFNKVKAAIKLQLRDVDTFIHPDFKEEKDMRYIKKIRDTNMPRENFIKMIEAIKEQGCIPMATAFDENSVEFCRELGLPIIKIASSDIDDWSLIEKIAELKKPVIVSTGGATLEDIDNFVKYFEKQDIHIAINHCVAIYPSEDYELDLNQIDFLKKRYPGVTIGFSSHEYNDWRDSILVAYAKGARTFERHVDIEMDGIPVSPYCSLPQNVDAWFKAFHKAKELCGGNAEKRRMIPEKETIYLNALVRGVYSNKNLPAGHKLSKDDFFLAIPLQEGQVPARKIIRDHVLVHPTRKNQPIMIDMLDNY